MLDAVGHFVEAVHQAHVGIPVAELAAHAPAHGDIVDVGGDERQEPVRVDSRHVAHVVEDARERGGVALALLVTGPAVDIPGVRQRHTGVHVRGDVFDIRIAIARSHRRARHAIVEVAAAGGIAVAIFARQGEEAFGSEWQADPGRRGQRPAVGCVALSAFGFDVGVVLAIGDGGAATLARITQAQVDDTGDGVRAVLRGGAITQHLDGFDGRQRDRVEIDGGRTAAYRAVDVHQRRWMTALAVHQYQCLVGREASQGCGADVVGAVGDRRPRKIERGSGVAKRFGELGGAL